MDNIPVPSKSILGKAKAIWDTFPAHNKVGLGIGAAGITIGLGNMANNQRKLMLEKNRQNLDRQALMANQSK
jgi:hypothetical protein